MEGGDCETERPGTRHLKCEKKKKRDRAGEGGKEDKVEQ